ncbi:MAG TPA: DNA polymerase I [Bacteroides sp.]|nr:DNA polymerase I [Bacteroides sp.]
MEQEKKLFLLDAYALIYRAYYAFITNPMTNSKGLHTSTVFGFALTLEEILRKENPSHIAVVFDPPGPTFRKEMFADYKANREAMPEDIESSIPYIKTLIEGFNIPILEQPGYEADDVIGTIAKKAEKEGYIVYMMTPDKDFAQLVSDRIFMYKPGRAGAPPEILGPGEVREKFLVEHPSQVIDILALWGDTSDNIPGVPGIGEKTAKKLISQYKTVEGIYDNLDQFQGKQKEKLEDSREQVALSKKLATIMLEVPVQVDIEKMTRGSINPSMLRQLFEELEFKNLAQKILGETDSPESKSPHGGQGTLFGQEEISEKSLKENAYDSIQTVKHHYELIRDIEGVKTLAGKLSALKEFCFDTETTGLDFMDADLVGIAFSWEAHRAYYVAFGQNDAEIQQWLNILKEPLHNREIRKIGQNLKYDLHILKNYGIDVQGNMFDTMVAHFILQPEQKHNLNILAEQYLGYTMVKIEALIGKKGVAQSSFRSVSLEDAKEYAGEDADITFQLSGIFRNQLRKEGFSTLSDQIEMPLVPVLMKMEHAGVRLDVDALKGFAEVLKKEILALEQDIYDLAGFQFNIGSPRQLGEVLFDRLKIISDPRKTKTKQYATGEEVLLQLTDKHPIVNQVLEHRSLRKLLSTYVDNLPHLVHPKTGKIHTSFNQVQVTTGRLSSVNPNLQNIPIREERGREIRKAFLPTGENNLFLSADYSQIELRLMAHLSEDTQMIEAFVNNEDIHTATAAKIFRVGTEEVTREMRSKAKTANFGIIYGISAFGLSQRMRISRTEARELIDGYFATYPGVRAYMDRCVKTAREKGYVETMYGRRRNLPDIHSRNSVVRGNAERNAINTPIQGSAADVIKIAMVNIQEAFEAQKLQSRMILQVHDELTFDVLQGELERVQRIVKDRMENATELRVPLTVEMGTGSNWLEAH